MTDIKAMEDRIDEAADAQAAASEQIFDAAQTKAAQIALDVARMVQEKHQGVPPAVLTSALISATASLLALFAKGNPIKVTEGANLMHKQLRATALRMMDNAKKRTVDGAQAN